MFILGLLFAVFTGCMINVDGKWIPADNYREIEE